MKHDIEIFVILIVVLIILVFFNPVETTDEEYTPVPVQEEIEAPNLTVIESVKFEPVGYLIDEDIPLDIQDCVEWYGTMYGISPELLEAIAYKESRYNPKAEAAGCVGLMQISKKWHKDRMERLGVTDEDLYTVDGSMHIAADYLAELFEKYEDAGMVLMIYNGDSNASAYYEGEHLISDYAAEILEHADRLTEKHGKSL